MKYYVLETHSLGNADMTGHGLHSGLEGSWALVVNQSLPTGPGWTLLQSSQSRGVVTEPTSRAAGHRAGQGRGPQARLQGALPCPGLRGELIREELFGLISEVRVTVGGESLCKAVRGCEPRKHEKPGLPGQVKGWRAGGPWGQWRAPPPGTLCSLKASQGTWSAKQPHHQLPWRAPLGQTHPQTQREGSVRLPPNPWLPGTWCQTSVPLH